MGTYKTPTDMPMPTAGEWEGALRPTFQAASFPNAQVDTNQCPTGEHPGDGEHPQGMGNAHRGQGEHPLGAMSLGEGEASTFA